MLCVITVALSMRSFLVVSVYLSVFAGRELTENAALGIRLDLFQALSGYLRFTNAILNTKEMLSNIVVNVPSC